MSEIKKREFNDEEQIEIGKRVSHYRNLRLWSQNTLGNKVNKSLGWINKFENGNSKMRCTKELLLEIANALQIDAEWLEPGSDLHNAADMPKLTREDISIVIPYSSDRISLLKEELSKLSDTQIMILKLALQELEL